MKNLHLSIFFSLVTTSLIVLSCLTDNQLSSDSILTEGVYIKEFSTPIDPLRPNELGLIGLHPDSVNLSNCQRISASDASKFKDLLFKSSSFNDNASVCWNPHFGAYFIEKGYIENYIEISLDCNRIAKKIPHIEPTALDQINIPRGMTPEFRNFIKYLLKKHDFKYEAEMQSRYD